CVQGEIFGVDLDSW
nr:immunoglobulin heavy chain junction region [Macaca mulatta]